MSLKLITKPFSFQLIQTLKTSKGLLTGKKGWLLRLEDSTGHCGWGEVSPLDRSELDLCSKVLKDLSTETSHQELEDGLTQWPGSLAFGIGAALAELKGLIGTKSKGGWKIAPPSAILLANNSSLLRTIDCLISNQRNQQSIAHPMTLKWKIAIESQAKEETLLAQILQRLPANARLRLDANSGLNREQAQKWSNHFKEDPRLEWLEQPLPSNDLEGLLKLSNQVPIALDESLLERPNLRKSWKDWQVRRPLLEGDPRPLLKELEEGVGYKMVSTSFETGIGLRWIHHLAALQQLGPTPTAPGLAPGWCPGGPLFSNNPQFVWQAA